MAESPLLRSLAPDLWEAPSVLSVGFVRFPLRMTVVRLPSRGLLLYSPVRLSDTLAEALVELGPVEHIVAPSRFHHLYAQGAKRRFPNARLWAAPGLQQKRPDVVFDAELRDSPPAEWLPALDVMQVQGAPGINEIVLFHKPSRSLICADLVFNVQDAPGWGGKMAGRILGVWKKFGVTRGFRFMVKDRAAYAASLRRILAWDVERVVMGHGEVVENAKAQVQDALGKWSRWS